jgi:hypothetical protein
MLQAYNNVAPNKLKMKDLYFLNADGGVPELLTIFKDSASEPGGSQFSNFRLKESNKEHSFVDDLFVKYKTRDPDEIWLKKLEKSHCSAIVKLIKN